MNAQPKGPRFDRVSQLLRSVKEALFSIYFLTLVGSVGFAFIVIFDDSEKIGWIFVAAVAGGLIVSLEDSTSGNRRLGALSGFEYRIDNRELLQIDIGGDVTARIDLDRMYRVDIPYRGAGVGVVRVRQDTETLEMPSTARGSDHIARSVLGIRQWPPDAIGTLPF